MVVMGFEQTDCVTSFIWYINENKNYNIKPIIAVAEYRTNINILEYINNNLQVLKLRSFMVLMQQNVEKFKILITKINKIKFDYRLSYYNNTVHIYCDNDSHIIQHDAKTKFFINWLEKNN
jgi:hypothetical protein